MKPIQIIIHDCRGEELYSKLSYLSSMIPIRQERRRDAIGISDGLIRPVIIIGKYGHWSKLAGLRPDFWIAGDDDSRTMLTLGASKIGGVELNRIEDVLKIVEILRVEGEVTMNNEGFIEELAERKISLKDFFDLLNIWEGMRYAEKDIVIRKLIEEEKNNEQNTGDKSC